MTAALVVANLLAFWYELSLGRQLGALLERWGLVPLAVTAALGGGPGQLGALAGSASWWGHRIGLIAGLILVSLYRYLR